MDSDISALNARVSDDVAPLTVSDEACPIETKKKHLNKILSAKGIEQKKIDIAHSQDHFKPLPVEFSQREKEISQDHIE